MVVPWDRASHGKALPLQPATAQPCAPLPFCHSQGQTFNSTAWRWFAMPIACNASQNIVLAVSDTSKVAAVGRELAWHWLRCGTPACL